MPSVSEKQRRTMQAADADPTFARKVGIPPKVAAEYAAADRSEAVAEAEADGYVKRAPTPRKRGQFGLPKSPKKRT